ncbi:putative membrane protein [Aquimarina amphilecti]|uniref:Putative membrane protein n=1 Tax=Aquimarina amphilecti TaxID=1038014 RepID=A0A1H7H871_AQUAM|nr:bestrophin family ion channel [Aquimarina amphilecti]SEK46484.1 putative membrane protein [Aquimarina amphilecti]
MYTKKNYTIKRMLSWTRRYIFMFILLSTIPVVLYEVLDWKWLHLPWLPIGLVGTALAFIIGFKNNASYGRLWEARKIYGGIVNASRLLATMVNDFITNEYALKDRTDAEFFEIKKSMIMRHVAWMTALRHTLRVKKPWETTTNNKSDQEVMKKLHIQEYAFTLEEELKDYLSKEEKQAVLSKTNKQTAVLNLQSKAIKELKLDGLIDDFRHVEFKNMIGELFTLQGKAERIKNFPYPRQFATLNLFFAWIFVALLPFGLMSEFEKIGETLNGSNHTGILFQFISENFVWLTIPFSVVISWIFFTMERIGDVSENPFEGIANDVPITTISRGIEIDIREMIGDDKNEIPKPHPEYEHTQM